MFGEKNALPKRAFGFSIFVGGGGHFCICIRCFDLHCGKVFHIMEFCFVNKPGCPADNNLLVSSCQSFIQKAELFVLLIDVETIQAIKEAQACDLGASILSTLQQLHLNLTLKKYFWKMCLSLMIAFLS